MPETAVFYVSKAYQKAYTNSTPNDIKTSQNSQLCNIMSDTKQSNDNYNLRINKTS